MKIVSLNLNGIRSACKKGFLQWLPKQNADITCLQEIRIQSEQLIGEMQNPSGMNGIFQFAQKKGYSGVGLYVRKKPDRIIREIGLPEMDGEGRYIQADYGSLSVISLYLPSGSSGDERQQFKYRVMDLFAMWMEKRLREGREMVICGDWNIAHREIDLKNWRGNRKNSGFLPEEREWMTMIFEKLGFIDVFRTLNPEADQYTWWSNRGQAWAKNVGWRIDYQIATAGIAATARSTSIYKDERFSDHAPLIVDYDYQI